MLILNRVWGHDQQSSFYEIFGQFSSNINSEWGNKRHLEKQTGQCPCSKRTQAKLLDFFKFDNEAK